MVSQLHIFSAFPNNNHIQMVSNRNLNIFIPIINNGGIIGTQSPRTTKIRKNRQYGRKQRRVQLIDNKDTLNRIASLSTQITNDPLINDLFNGSPFI